MKISNIQLLRFWEPIRASYWFVPSLMTIGAILLAIGMIELDHAVPDGAMKQLGWAYSGGPEGARAVLATVAGSVMSTAGVTFSITIAALSLASGQFGPRLLNNFMRDTGNQVVLGTFIATFLYCLLVLRTIRGVDGAQFVPSLAVSVGVLLGLASLGVLIFFIDHVARSIQAPHVIAEVAHELHHSIEQMYPTHIGSEAPEIRLRHIDDEIPADFERCAGRVCSADNGYVQGIDETKLIRLATELDLLLRMEHRPGDFVVRHMPLVRVWPPESLTAEVAEQIQDAWVFGISRTQRQDAAYSVAQLVEVAVRALSPGINDPFTAMQCLDQLAAALSHLAQSRFPTIYRFDDEQTLRVIAPRIYTFPEMVDIAFDQIRHYGRDSTTVTLRMLDSVATVLHFAEGDTDRAALLRQAEMIRRGARETLPEPQDLQEVELRYGAVQRVLDVRRVAAPLPDARQPV